MPGLTPGSFTVTTERLYRRLPEFYQRADVDNGLVFKQWISGIVDIAGELEELTDRIGISAVDGSQSELADLELADDEWLLWIAMMLGSPIKDDLDYQSIRTLLQSTNFFRGTKAHIEAAAATALTGDRFVAVYDHSTSVATRGEGTEWDVLIVTKQNETPTNLIPRQAATFGAAADWVPDTPANTVQKIVTVDQGFNVYRNRAMEVSTTVANAWHVRDDWETPAAPGDVFSAVLTDWFHILDPSAEIAIEWLNAANSVISAVSVGTTEIEAVGDVIKVTRHVTGTAPALTTAVRVAIACDATAGANLHYFAQAGLYAGLTYGWSSSDSDPLGAVINAGAAPSGVILYHEVVDNTFDAVEGEFATWDEIDSATWDDLETAE